MWPQCLKFGVAAITYDPLAYTDLSKHPRGEPKDLWNQLAPTQKASLKRLAYEMKKDDVIFVKHGDRIICRGKVKGRYRYDSAQRIIDPNGIPWPHQVPVAWDASFAEVRILFGGEQIAVKRLSGEDLNDLGSKRKETEHSNQRDEAIEGRLFKREALFRTRNAALIRAKKQDSDYRCEKCGFSFYDTYGEIGKEFIIAHHVEPISSRRKPRKTTFDEIALLCANCHAMIHRKSPAVGIQDLPLKNH
jgi:predicted HNH restriction endonuclease